MKKLMLVILVILAGVSLAFCPAPKLVLSHICTTGEMVFIANNIPEPITDYGQVDFGAQQPDGAPFLGVAAFDRQTGNAIHYQWVSGYPPLTSLTILTGTLTIDGLLMELHNPGEYDAIACAPTAIGLRAFTATNRWQQFWNWLR